jgi:hypothetical protein
VSNFGKKGVIWKVNCFVVSHTHIYIQFHFIHSNGDILTEILHQVPCTVGDGGVFSILAFIMYFLSGVFICCVPKPKPVLCQKESEGTSSSGHSAMKSTVDVETPVESSKSATFT